MSRSERLISAALAVLLVAGVLILLFGPARGLRNDISAQRGLIAEQLAVLQLQLETTRGQLDEARRTRELTEDVLSEAGRPREVAEQTLAQTQRAVELAEQTLAIAEQTQANTAEAVVLLREQVALSRQLLAVAQQTL